MVEPDEEGAPQGVDDGSQESSTTSGGPAPWDAQILTELLVTPFGEQPKWQSLLQAAMLHACREPGRLGQLVRDLNGLDQDTLVTTLTPALEDLAGAVLRGALEARVLDPATARTRVLEPPALWAALRDLPARDGGRAHAKLDALCAAVRDVFGGEESEPLLYRTVMVVQVEASDLEGLRGTPAAPSEDRMRELFKSLLELDPELVGEHLHTTDAGRRELLEALAYVRANAGELLGGQGEAARADAPVGTVPAPRIWIRPANGNVFFVEFDGAVSEPLNMKQVNARVLFHVVTSCRGGLHALDLETLVDGGSLGDLSMDKDACLELAKRLGVELSLIGPPSPAIGALLRRLEFLETTPVHPWRQVKKGSTRWTVEKEQTLVRAALSDRVYTPQHEREDPVMRSKKRLRRASDTAARTLKESAPAAAAYYKGCVSWDDTIVFTDPN